jgi:hypothetical protein
MHGEIVAELQRLRFGSPATWRAPELIFRRARKEWRRRA